MIARRLRRDETPAEALLWKYLRGRRLQGLKFLRQHPIPFLQDERERFFIADFYCHETGLIVELDGSSHVGKEEYDAFRTTVLEQLGLTVLRFENREVMENVEAVLAKLTPGPSLGKRGEGCCCSGNK